MSENGSPDPSCEPEEPRPSDVAVARAMRDLESQICDLQNMATIVASLSESALGEQPKGTPECMCYVPNRESHLFGIYHVEQMAKDLKTAFYAAFNPEPQSEQSAP
jgi:hypothetical protein